MGMAHFMVLLDLPLRPEITFPLIQCVAILASVHLPQPAYVCSLPLPGKPAHVTISPTILCATHVENYSVVTKEKLQYFEAEIRPAYVS